MPILGLQYSDSSNGISPVSDSNGYQYLLVTVNTGPSTAYMHASINWYQDSAGAVFMGSTDWVVPPASFIAQKIPVATRYYTMEMGPVGGGNGSSIGMTIYGTNADQENLLTQQTAQPMLFVGPTIAAGATDTETVSGIFGGSVQLSINDTANKLWSAKLQFYNWADQAFHSIWGGYGADLGQAWSGMVNLPYAPIRLLTTNTDTAAHQFFLAVVAP